VAFEKIMFQHGLCHLISNDVEKMRISTLENDKSQFLNFLEGKLTRGLNK
jgi:hypothetical protein